MGAILLVLAMVGMVLLVGALLGFLFGGVYLCLSKKPTSPAFKTADKVFCTTWGTIACLGVWFVLFELSYFEPMDDYANQTREVNTVIYNLTVNDDHTSGIDMIRIGWAYATDTWTGYSQRQSTLNHLKYEEFRKGLSIP